MNRFRLLLAVTLIVTLFTVTPSPLAPVASAHGGVIIDGGFTDNYEWIAMASPFPVTPGETILTVLIYDIETYAPINGLVPTLELAPPDTPRPCCEGDRILGPLPLLVDPILYPGDYSNITLLLQKGSWQGRFTIDADDPVGPGELTEIFFNVDVREAQEGEERPTPVDAPIISQTATAIALNPNSGAESATASEESYPEPVPPLEAANAAGESEAGESEAGESEAGEGTQESEEASDVEAANTAAAEGSEETAMSTPYPPPAAPEDAADDKANQDGTTQDNQSTESADSGSTGGGATELPANEEQPSSGSGFSWASQNLWLLAALALVPLLLVIVWFLLSNNNEDNEWSGDPEE